MITELYLYSQHFFKAKFRNRYFGHLQEIIALNSRAKRLQKEWALHHQNCHQVILEFIKLNLLPNPNSNSNSNSNSKVLILGAGLLNEIPIELLSRLCQKITLVDTFFLNETKNKIEKLKGQSNIQFIEHDITELEEKMMINPNAAIEIPQKFLDDEYDFVLSINLWSQLIRHFKVLDNRPDEEFKKVAILNAHLDYLLSFKNSKILFISDIETNIIDVNKCVIESNCFLNEILKNHRFSQMKTLVNIMWDWNTAPHGEWKKNAAIQMKVIALGLQR